MVILTLDNENSNILNRKQFCVIIMCYVAVLSHSDAISNSIVCSYEYDILRILTLEIIYFVDVCRMLTITNSHRLLYKFDHIE